MILVTGGSGFIGSHLLEALAAQGESVRALVRRSIVLPSGVEPFQANLANSSSLDAALDDVSTVIHVAGVTKALNTAGYYQGNTKASDNLARAAAHSGARFLHISSLAACGPTTTGQALNEECDLRPVSNYGKSKLEAEKAVRAALPGAIIVRPPVVYGPRETGVFEIFRSVSRGVVLRIAGGDRWFSMIYVHDLVAGLMLLLRRPEADGRTYFLSHPQPVSWSELDTTAARIMNRSPRVVTVPLGVAYTVGSLAEAWAQIVRRPATISREKISEAACPAWVCDPSRAAADLGFVAPTSLATGLGVTLAWYKEAGWIRY